MVSLLMPSLTKTRKTERKKMPIGILSTHACTDLSTHREEKREKKKEAYMTGERQKNK